MESSESRKSAFGIFSKKKPTGKEKEQKETKQEPAVVAQPVVAVESSEMAAPKVEGVQENSQEVSEKPSQDPGSNSDEEPSTFFFSFFIFILFIYFFF
jgi:hypothetical protein